MKIAKFLIIFLLFSLLYFFIPQHSDKLIYIPPKSDKNRYIAVALQDTPLNRADIFLLNLVNYKSGWIRVNSYTNRYKIVKKILSDKREKTRYIVMYSGESIEDFTKKLSKQTHLNSSKILKIYHNIIQFKDGAILAGRYKIPFKTTEHSTLAYLIYKSYSKLIDLTKKYNTDIDSKEFQDKMIVASIIQKETQKRAEMPIIASVIYNRLNRGMKLQMDATLNYGKWANVAVTPQRIKTDNTKFNTYKYNGLPPQILCAVSLDAIEASFNPAKTNYLYFVKSKNGHKFSTKYKKHQKFVKNYKNRLAMYRHIKEILYVKFYQPTAKFRLNYKKLDIIAPKKE